MPADLESILPAALRLSQDDCARLADSLLSTLEPADEAGIEEAWTTEVEERSREFDEGNVTPIPWNVVRESVRRQFLPHE